jgi:UDP-glucose 4-epimerase
MAPSASPRRLRVAVTGASGDLGALLLAHLQRDPRIEKILVFDLAQPQGERIVYHHLDLTRHDAEDELVDALTEEPVDALFHLAFRRGSGGNSALAHELEISGTIHVLAASARLQLPRLIIPSLTAAYGPRPDHPAQISEDAPLHGVARSRYVRDKLELERQVERFSAAHPETKVFVLRFAPIVGPHMDNVVVRLLSAPVVPTLLGYDPLWQALHEEDAVRALMCTLDATEPGTFNIVGKGVMPFSSLARCAGALPVPVPGGLLQTAVRVFDTVGASTVHLPLIGFLRYAVIADGRRAAEQLGFVPEYGTGEAAGSIRGMS